MEKSQRIVNSNQVGGKIIRREWLAGFDELKYYNYLVNSFYLLLLFDNVEMAKIREPDNTIRITELNTEIKSILNDNFLPKTYTTNVS